MFKRIIKKLNRARLMDSEQQLVVEDLNVSSRLDETVSSITKIIGESDDFIQREILIGQKFPAVLFFIEGLCDRDKLEQHVMRPLLSAELELPDVPSAPLLQKLIKETITLTSVSVFETFEDAIPDLMSGNTLLVIEGIKKLIILKTLGFDKRSIEEPESEVLIRGPRDGFVETLLTNITLVRRRVIHPQLTIQKSRLGRKGNVAFALAYIKGIVNADLVEEVRYRLACIDTDHIFESGELEQLLEDSVLSPFPQLMHTERPDKAASALFNGQVLIMVDGAPFALIAPVTFHQLMKSPEDYYDRWYLGTVIRILRYFAAFISLFLPALYIAMVSYHQGMIPTPLALSIAGAREGVPFPAFIEAMVMEITIELLREAGIRLPRPVGQTIGIVGGLIIGEAAVRAGIVSPIMVIVVALTAVSSFAIPAYSMSITLRILRFLIMIAAATLGLYGIIAFFILLNIHLVGLQSFGSYYMSPLAPYHMMDWLDLFLRAPLTLLRYRSKEPRTMDDQKKE
jgi:spore germination protein